MITAIQRGNEKASKTAARNVFRKGKKASDRDPGGSGGAHGTPSYGRRVAPLYHACMGSLGHKYRESIYQTRTSLLSDAHSVPPAGQPGLTRGHPWRIGLRCGCAAPRVSAALGHSTDTRALKAEELSRMPRTHVVHYGRGRKIAEALFAIERRQDALPRSPLESRRHVPTSHEPMSPTCPRLFPLG